MLFGVFVNTVLVIFAVTLSSTKVPLSVSPGYPVWPPVPKSASSTSILNCNCVALANAVLVLAYILKTLSSYIVVPVGSPIFGAPTVEPPNFSKTFVHVEPLPMVALL